MFRPALLASTAAICIVSLSCQTYTTGVQQTVARADETVALGALRATALAQRTYAVSNGGDYGTFQQLCEGGYLDSRFNSSKPQLKDYVLTMEVHPKSGSESEGFYSCSADPVSTGNQAGRHLYIDSTSNEIHLNSAQPATAKDPIFH
jgi:hypothetical protein